MHVHFHKDSRSKYKMHTSTSTPVVCMDHIKSTYTMFPKGCTHKHRHRTMCAHAFTLIHNRSACRAPADPRRQVHINTGTRPTSGLLPGTLRILRSTFPSPARFSPQSLNTPLSQPLAKYTRAAKNGAVAIASGRPRCTAPFPPCSARSPP